jgi:hypothetical protein
MEIYINSKFEIVAKENATMIKIIPSNGEPPYFIEVSKKQSEIKKENNAPR